MNRVFLTAALLVAPAAATSSTKHIDCTQITDKGVLQVIRATVDDRSDKAEVQMFATSAECAKNDSCGTDVYKKDVCQVSCVSLVFFHPELCPTRQSLT